MKLLHRPAAFATALALLSPFASAQFGPVPDSALHYEQFRANRGRHVAYDATYDQYVGVRFLPSKLDPRLFLDFASRFAIGQTRWLASWGPTLDIRNDGLDIVNIVTNEDNATVVLHRQFDNPSNAVGSSNVLMLRRNRATNWSIEWFRELFPVPHDTYIDLVSVEPSATNAGAMYLAGHLREVGGDGSEPFLMHFRSNGAIDWAYWLNMSPGIEFHDMVVTDSEILATGSAPGELGIPEVHVTRFDLGDHSVTTRRYENLFVGFEGTVPICTYPGNPFAFLAATTQLDDIAIVPISRGSLQPTTIERHMSTVPFGTFDPGGIRDIVFAPPGRLHVILGKDEGTVFPVPLQVLITRTSIVNSPVTGDPPRLFAASSTSDFLQFGSPYGFFSGSTTTVCSTQVDPNGGPVYDLLRTFESTADHYSYPCMNELSTPSQQFRVLGSEPIFTSANPVGLYTEDLWVSFPSIRNWVTPVPLCE